MGFDDLAVWVRMADGGELLVGATLHDQWRRETRLKAASRIQAVDIVTFADFVARHPWCYGRDVLEETPEGGTALRARLILNEARALLRTVRGNAPTRWKVTDALSPSGCTLFACGGCGRVSKVPVVGPCRLRVVTCTDEAVAWGAAWLLVP